MKLHIQKDRLKFSSAHMTVFPDGSKEALHGHNYQVIFEGETAATTLKEMAPFSDYKKALSKICDAWDEKVLIAQDCPYLKMKAANKTSVSFTLCGKEYLLPKEETVFLRTDNITSENLATLFLELFLQTLTQKTKNTLLSASIRVEESPGQGATAEWKNGKI